MAKKKTTSVKQEDTKDAYEKYLNEIGKSLDTDEFIIGGIMRNPEKGYGNMLRKHDPISFNVGYNEWLREQK